MLRNTFIHFPGVGPADEEELWLDGCLSWEDMVARRRRGRTADGHAEEAAASIDRLDAGDAVYFRSRLPRRESWRAYPDFLDDAVFLDIETTGLSPESSYVTLVGTLDRRGYTAYVRGDNLDELPAALRRYKLVVTYNGASFDLPFLERCFEGTRPGAAERRPSSGGPEPGAAERRPCRGLDPGEHPHRTNFGRGAALPRSGGRTPDDRLFGHLMHIDLRYPLARAGYRGGLKRIEKATGLGRPSALSGLDGASAVALWEMANSGEPRALETLIRYNAEDVASLPRLAALAFDRLAELLPIDVPEAPRLSEFDTSAMPYDKGLVEYLGRFG